SDALQVLSAARILALQAQSDDNLALIQRGTGAAYVEDFSKVTGDLHGLLRYAQRIATRTGSGSRLRGIRDDLGRVVATHEQVRKLDDGGDYQTAVNLQIGDGSSNAQRLDAALAGEIGAARARLDAEATDARGGFDALIVAIVVLLVLSGALVLLGL